MTKQTDSIVQRVSVCRRSQLWSNPPQSSLPQLLARTTLNAQVQQQQQLLLMLPTPPPDENITFPHRCPSSALTCVPALSIVLAGGRLQHRDCASFGMPDTWSCGFPPPHSIVAFVGLKGRNTRVGWQQWMQARPSADCNPHGIRRYKPSIQREKLADQQENFTVQPSVKSDKRTATTLSLSKPASRPIGGSATDR